MYRLAVLALICSISVSHAATNYPTGCVDFDHVGHSILIEERARLIYWQTQCPIFSAIKSANDLEVRCDVDFGPSAAPIAGMSVQFRKRPGGQLDTSVHAVNGSIVIDGEEFRTDHSFNGKNGYWTKPEAVTRIVLALCLGSKLSVTSGKSYVPLTGLCELIRKTKDRIQECVR